MAWYAAHVIMYMRFKDGNRDRYPVYENIYLFQTESAEEALKLAEQGGRQSEGDSSGSLKWEARPAFPAYAGVRKLIKAQSQGVAVSETSQLHGREITYSSFQLDAGLVDETCFRRTCARLLRRMSLSA